MIKTVIILAITAAATTVCISLPQIIEHLGEGFHIATIIISGHHILDEILHSIHPRKPQQELT